jgi:hypothetical protein
LSLTYLGLSFKVQNVWNSIIEQVENRLTSWKKLYLSKGRRIRLLTITLSSLCAYFLSLFTIPVNVANRIEKLRQNRSGED